MKSATWVFVFFAVVFGLAVSTGTAEPSFTNISPKQDQLVIQKLVKEVREQGWGPGRYNIQTSNLLGCSAVCSSVVSQFIAFIPDWYRDEHVRSRYRILVGGDENRLFVLFLDERWQSQTPPTKSVA